MSNTSASNLPLGPRAAFRLALVVGVAAAALSAELARRHSSFGDFLAWWHGARVLLAGGDPYASPPTLAPFFIDEQLFYPMTALVATVPFAPLPYHVAIGAFFGLGAGLLAYGVARQGPHWLAVFCSFPFMAAAQLGHWSPWIAAAMLVPASGFLIAVKPNLGLAALVTRPSRAMLAGAALFVLISLIVSPSWPWRWLSIMGQAPPHLVPIASWLGAPLALALLRWRRAEARLLLAMALLPQTASFADQLLLFLVARTRAEALVLALASAAGGVAWMLAIGQGGHPVLIGGPYVVASVYLPALVVVLRHPNEGRVPAFLEERLRTLPGWLRGVAPPHDATTPITAD